MTMAIMFPRAGATAAIAAGISYIANEQFTWKRIISVVSIPSPMTSAKFAGSAIIALNIFSVLTSRGKTERNDQGIAKWTFAAVLIYGLHTYFNPDQTLRTLAVLAGIAAASQFISNFCIGDDKCQDTTLTVINNLPKSLVAAGATWLFAKSMGYDPKTLFITTLFQSILYYATNPLNKIIQPDIVAQIIRCATTLGISMAYKSAFDIKTPLYEAFVKTSLISGVAIGAVEILASRLKQQA